MIKRISNRIGLELLCRRWPRLIERPVVALGLYLTKGWGK